MVAGDKNIEEYGLIGYPLSHSFSKDYFNQKFSCENIDATYLNFELPDIGDLMEIISEHPKLNGLNVTIPYKEQVLPYLDEIDEDAENIGAVNVIKFIRSKSDIKLKGFNSDIIGFMESIKPLLNSNDKYALILGTGGAAKAVNYGLKKLGFSCLYVSRTPSEGNLTYSDLSAEIMDKFTVIVNSTPLGMYPKTDDCPDIPYQYLDKKHLCYDLLYNPDETLFLKKAKDQGSRVKNGLEMLLLQAFESWKIWQSE